jgi:hypothetical protein
MLCVFTADPVAVKKSTEIGMMSRSSAKSTVDIVLIIRDELAAHSEVYAPRFREDCRAWLQENILSTWASSVKP